MKKRLNKKYILSTLIIVLLLSGIYVSVKNGFKLSNLTNSLNRNEIVSEDITVTVAKGKLEVTLVSGVDLIPDSKKAADMKKNTTNLQKTIDNLSDNGGGTIYLPAGTFYFSQGGIAAHGNEDYVIHCRNNVHLKGAGTNENNLNYLTVLKPYYYAPKADGGMDMFYFNNYADTNYSNDGKVTTSTVKDLTFTDMNGTKQTLKNQTVYLINADFSDFIVDADEARGGIASCGGTYKTDGKGFMINLFKDCDWNNVVVKNTDATGFGIDCPLNSTMTNCKAINCGKAATTTDGGASGFGIGVGYDNNESLIIKNCIALNNKKFGFFFEHQARFSEDHYKATTSGNFVVSNSVAGGNMYDFGGLKAYDVIYENVKSVSGQTYYSHADFKKTTSATTSTCDAYTKLNYSTATGITLGKNVQPVFFSLYTTKVQMINSNITTNVTDIKDDVTESKWAINKGILSIVNGKTFSPTKTLTKFDALRTFMIYENYQGNVIPRTTNKDKNENLKTIQNIGYTDITTAYNEEYDIIVWAYNKGLISKDTKLNPQSDCTRAMYITMLYRLAGSPSVTATIPFTDVKSSDWYYKAVTWGYSVGIIQGSSNNTFDPNRSITKREVAIFLYRYNELKTNNYTITYSLNEGSVTGNPIAYKQTSSKITLKNPTKTGYTFAGWSGSNGATPSKTVTIATGTKGDLAYTAHWSPNLTEIAIKSNPTKTTYYVGESLDTKGLMLTTYYYDSSSSKVGNGFTVSPSKLSNIGTQKITVTYKGKTTTFNVTVKNNNVKSLTIKTLPTKTTYFPGDTINLDGLTLAATYEDGSTKTISSGLTISPTSVQSIGTQKVTINYGGKTTTFDVTVKSNNIKSISVKTQPTKTIYYTGEQIKTDGLSLTATYDDGSTKIVSTGFSITPTTTLSPGTQKVTVTYQGKTTTFNVTVKDNALKSISIKTKPKQIKYYQGDSLNTSGLSLELLYDDGTKNIITSGYEVEPIKLNTPGEQTITVKYSNKSTTFTVSVIKEEISSISIKHLPKQVTYYVGDTFKSEGLILNINKNSGYVEEITTGYTLSIQENSKLTKEGTHKVIVTYNNIQTSFNIEVKAVKKDSLILLSRPNKTSYIVGEPLELDGLKLEYIDLKGNKKEVLSEYNTSLKNGTTLNKKGTITIVVEYNKKKVNFEIEVKEITSITVELTELKTEYTVGEKFNEKNIVLIVNYSNNTKEKITTGYNVYIDDETTFTTPGQKEITIEYNGKKTTLTVNVVDEQINDDENQEDTTKDDEITTQKNNTMVIIICTSIFILVVAIIIVIVVINKRKNKTNYYS